MTVEEPSSWNAALAVLRTHVPAATGFNPDEIDEAARTAGIQLNWIRVPNFDGLDDHDIWNILAPGIPWAADTAVTIVVDVCYYEDRSPFKVKFGDLPGWIEGFGNRFEDEIFGGDAIFVCDVGALVVHHEGVYAGVQFCPEVT